MVTYKGASLIYRTEWSYSQDEGWNRVVHARGRKDNVIGFSEGWRRSGYDITLSQDGPYWGMLAKKTSNDSGHQWIERWVLATEILEKDIFSKPAVAAEMFAYADGPAKYRKAVEEAVSTGDSTKGPTGTVESIWVIRELTRGVEGYEHEYHILSRTVTFPSTWAGDVPAPFDMSLKLSGTILTSSQLNAQQSIPDDVLFTLPPDRTGAELAEDSSASVMWGWRMREQKAEIDTSTTGSFQLSWTYAAWSTFIYTPYSP